ncbi:MAG TPA: 30S ribosomal protein S20 [Candidatus Saccharimonadales bacterium]|nr:30S ribosomal protein S20 [Candidatus Saccharimonadales bacterium]
MPIIQSAKKRVRTARKAGARNSKTKRNFKSALKLFGAKPSAQSLSSAQSKLDTAAKKGVIHKNKAARLKKRAAAKAKAAGVKPSKASAKKAPAAKPAAKKTTPKKTPAKKAPTTKK